MLAITLFGLAMICWGIAIVNERRMQKHRQPGVSYRDVTFRRDGGWRRTDLFTEAGLTYQRRASTFGVLGLVFLLLALSTGMAGR